MPLAHTFRIGRLTCHALEGGFQRLDGGAMFGVVPKPLWSRRIPPDERNRILLAMRSLLVEHADGLVLIETGLGNKEDAKFLDIYGVENRGVAGPTRLEDALLEVGYRPEEIAWVINTHLHFDHAGGNTVRVDEGGAARPGTEAVASAHLRLAFPNATYLVQRGELEFARHPNERTRASYLPPNFEPVAAAGRWQLAEGDGEPLPGIRVRLTPGHVPFHQSVLVSSEGETLIYLGDIIPTSAHLPLPYIMGYDLEPLRTLETKRALLKEAAQQEWWLFFGHDAGVVRGKLDAQGKEMRDVLRADG
jgi:glyoxylase-like metal-dependent hydrolase (beta-lactamase superfamily II)